jgi:hypothetical protein
MFKNGDKFGKLQVLECAEPDIYLCLCECGTQLYVWRSLLAGKLKVHCGGPKHLRPSKRNTWTIEWYERLKYLRDVEKKTWAQIAVLMGLGTGRQSMMTAYYKARPWEVQLVDPDRVISYDGHCVVIVRGKRKGKHLKSAEFQTWYGMIQRCYGKNSTGYSEYGGRGIRVCKRWRKANGKRTMSLQGFRNFLADMGPRPDGMTIDRKDVNKGYSPQNCRWAPKRVQVLNRRNPRYIKGRLVFAQQPELLKKVRALRESGLSYAKIGSKLGMNWGTVRNLYLDHRSGEVKRRRIRETARLIRRLIFEGRVAAAIFASP